MTAGGLTAVEGRVDVWRIPLRHPAHLTARPERWLDAAERARAAGYAAPAARLRFVRARGTVRRVLAAYTGVPAGQLDVRAGGHGKPRLHGPADAPAFNVSHAGDTVLLAVARDREVGIDVEAPRPDLPAAGLARRFYPPAEREWVCADGLPEAERIRRYVRLWTRKEAYVKAAGGRLAQGMGVPVGPLAPAEGRPVTGPLGVTALTDLPSVEGGLASVALTGPATYDIALRSWPADLPR